MPRDVYIRQCLWFTGAAGIALSWLGAYADASVVWLVFLAFFLQGSARLWIMDRFMTIYCLECKKTTWGNGWGVAYDTGTVVCRCGSVLTKILDPVTPSA